MFAWFPRIHNDPSECVSFCVCVFRDSSDLSVVLEYVTVFIFSLIHLNTEFAFFLFSISIIRLSITIFSIVDYERSVADGLFSYNRKTATGKPPLRKWYDIGA